MTDVLLHPDDSGEVTRLPGETARIITGVERERLIGEATQNLGQYARPDAPFGYLRKTFDIDDTVTYMPATIGLAGPQSPPPPLPPPPPPPPTSLYDAQPIAPWERVADTAHLTLLGSVAGMDGDLRPAAPGPKPGPLPPDPQPAPAPKPNYAGRHRLTLGRRVRRLLAGVGVVGLAVAAIWAGLTLAAVAVFL